MAMSSVRLNPPAKLSTVSSAWLATNTPWPGSGLPARPGTTVAPSMNAAASRRMSVPATDTPGGDVGTRGGRAGQGDGVGVAVGHDVDAAGGQHDRTRVDVGPGPVVQRHQR